MAFAPFDEAELAIVRRAFARQIMAIAGVQDEQVERAFAAVRRENFLGTEPWQRDRAVGPQLRRAGGLGATVLTR